MKEIKIEDILNDAWYGFKENWQQLLIMSLVLCVAPMVIFIVVFYGGVFAMAANQSENPTGVFALVGIGYLIMFLVIILASGFYKVSFLIYQGKKVQFSDVFMDMSSYIRVLGLGIIMGLAISLGSLLCVIPGLLAAFFFSLSMNIVIEDKNKGIFDAIKESCSLVKSNWQPVLFSLLILCVINGVLGSTGIGSIISMPAAALITTALYLRVKNNNSLGNETAALAE